LPDKDSQPPRREVAAVEVEQINSVKAEEVGLYLVAVLIEYGIEAR